MKINEFKNPDKIYRPSPFWSLNDKLNGKEMRRQIREMSDKGWGGFFMHSRVGLVTGYLSDEWMSVISECIDEAKKTGTYAWIYDEDKWPSGYAGGEIPKNPDFRMRGLALLKENEITDNDTVLTEYIFEDTKYFICKRILATGNKWFNNMCYVDLMNPKMVRAFLDSTHEKYKALFEDSFGKEIPGVFTDEPCYLTGGDFFCPVVPWTETLPNFFFDSKGYSIDDHLAELFFDVDDYNKTRYDFYSCCNSLFLESFTKQYYKWCDDNNLKLTGHFMAEDSLLSQIQWSGAVMPHYEFMHWPGIDKLFKHVKQIVTVKQLSSVCDQLKKERCFAEVFAGLGQNASFYHRKWIADWQATLGINFVNHHLSLYSMRGERKRDWPANFFYQQPWWNYEKKLADYITRLCYICAIGKRLVNILVIHPSATAFSLYSPLNTEKIDKIDESFYNLSLALLEKQLDYHYGDETIIANHGFMAKDTFNIGEFSYSTIIVPPCITLSSGTIDFLNKSAATGNTVIIQGNKLERVDGIKTDIKWDNGIIFAKTQEEAVEIADASNKERVTVINTDTLNYANKVFCHNRKDENEEWILITNSDEKEEYNIKINLVNNKTPYTMGLNSGDIYSLKSVYNKDDSINLKIYSGGSFVIYYPKEDLEVKNVPDYLESGVNFETEDASVTTPDIVWDATACEENILALKDVSFYLDGKCILENEPVNKVWHKHFYASEDGTPFKAEYIFNVEELPTCDIFAVIELAENLDNISLNGKKLTPLKQKGEEAVFNEKQSWKDVNFTKVPLLDSLKKGENKLIIEGKKINNVIGANMHLPVEDFQNHNATEVEAIYIVGNFNVQTKDNITFYINGNSSAPDIKDISLSNYPFYTGKFMLEGEISIPEINNKVLIKFNDVSAACIELSINDKEIGVRYTKPFVYDVTKHIKEGKNKIKVTIANTLFNILGPNKVKDILQRDIVSPHTFLDFENFGKEYILDPFGIGEINIITKK